MPNRYRIDGATNITGSLTITGSVIATSFSGSFSGSGANLTDISTTWGTITGTLSNQTDLNDTLTRMNSAVNLFNYYNFI